MLSVSTKTGDKGQSSLADGTRVPKTNHIFEVVGTLDELNSWLGLIAAKLGNEFPSHREYLLAIQDTLFYISAQLANAPKVSLKKSQLEELEKQSELLQKSMEGDWHSQFLLPGGTEIGAHIDITRTVCRRAEREVLRYADEHQVSPLILQYMNRLSDYLYVLRCFVNHQLLYRERKFKRS